ncbi:MAG: alpha/beta hydrolase [Erysipelotrichaceae bacterium]|nr:alpha/beta hydrolase [Erysipelotrichaceae bacterium]
MYKEWMIEIPELTGKEKRKAYIYVPDIFYSSEDMRFPVLYMFDGQNLFNDAEASFGKSWGLLKYLTEHDVPLIVAAIECNHHPEEYKLGGRLSEYSPFDFSDPYYGDIKGRGEKTMKYLLHVFKRHIDENYPTLPDRRHTFIGGSSMGGLMTLYALSTYNSYFYGGAALSPSLYFSPDEVKKMLKNGKYRKTVLYMDNGSKEMRSAVHRHIYGDVSAILINKGIHLCSRIVPDGIHSESSWEKQIPFFLNTLFYE